MFPISRKSNNAVQFALLLGCFVIPLCVAADAGEPATQPIIGGEVDVGVFVQSVTWSANRVTYFPVIVNCSCERGSRYENRHLVVIDGADWQEESDAMLHPKGNVSGPNPVASYPPHRRISGDFLVLFHDYMDVTGNHISDLGPLKPGTGTRDEQLLPYPVRTLSSGDGMFFVTSIDSSDTASVKCAKIILRAFVVVDDKVVGRSNEIMISVQNGKTGQL
jgi:hypothetical protein